MNRELKHIERLYGVINRSVFRIDGTLDYDRVTDAVIALCNAIDDYCRSYYRKGQDYDDAVWYIGESAECALSDFIVGAYWHYSDWHAGQSSNGYAAMSALGQVFSPGMTGPETDNTAYEMLNSMAESEVAA